MPYRHLLARATDQLPIFTRSTSTSQKCNTPSSSSTAAALVAPAVAQNGVPDGYSWAVSGWSAGTARSGSSYDFNATGIKDGYLPGFKAYCGGDDVGCFKDCTLPEGETNEGTGPPFVSAKLRPNQQDQIAQVTLSLKFQCASCTDPATYNFTGTHDATYNQFSPDLSASEFEVVVDGLTGVAK
ncbi:hypothetical protein CLAFUW4_04706 [Fulvia fulva]|uniref:Uncharacterized protein n=1 Tax=Passalora fulva TaxID=5499 RepID=A0A9Q8P7Y6_PASFU|nr:uncharacterized protein CLAFUR5_04666 [Fulvia fulva]KAK4626351.1 hypothetical protein CLAFUR4_04692 [Fulvia fulva]UJO16382.1 hypothetical protein CLAFUR5_04666 [Fulvia fulva]WPV14412.1 hypothetical protein CLAFUW4_04706 [Fulvia fulva]WPV28842.1 hypothetical protein CLAFUW7_04700 [Fulvia fulva]